MLTEKLFETLLIDPVTELGADTLSIVSGYATPGFAGLHLEHLQRRIRSGNIPHVQVVHGMVGREGMSMAHHKAFKQLDRTAADFSPFQCFYLVEEPHSHAKIYVWSRNDRPIKAFIGSVNYTWNGFHGLQREVVAVCDCHAAQAYFDQIRGESLSCSDPTVERRIDFSVNGASASLDSPRVNLPLVSRDGNPHSTAGLNWGQRAGRDPNQAYIPVPRATHRDNPGFFPPHGCPFTITTDDGESFIGVLAQQKSKAIHSLPSNAWLGGYFRRRLRVASGDPVKRHHLDAYGRSEVGFVKMADGEYYLDFAHH